MIAGGTLLSSYLFFRHTRLAETDTPAMLGVTAGILCLWMAARSTGWRQVLLFHLAAMGTALAAMTKGPPALFVVVFFLLYSVVERQWRLPWLFLRSGAWVTFIVTLTWLTVPSSPAMLMVEVTPVALLSGIDATL